MLCADRALDEAQAADAAISRGVAVGPLHGVPMTLKDSLDTEGVVTTGGTLGRLNFVPERDSTVAARLRGAGAILLGKTNTPEITFAGETDNLVYGRTNNPYGAGPHAGRQQRRRGRDSRGRRFAVRHRQRHRRQRPPARALQRHRRNQAQLRQGSAHRPYHPIRRRRGGRLHAERPHGAIRGRPHAYSTDHLRTRLGRPHDSAHAAWRSRRRPPSAI